MEVFLTIISTLIIQITVCVLCFLKKSNDVSPCIEHSLKENPIQLI